MALFALELAPSVILSLGHHFTEGSAGCGRTKLMTPILRPLLGIPGFAWPLSQPCKTPMAAGMTKELDRRRSVISDQGTSDFTFQTSGSANYYQLFFVRRRVFTSITVPVTPAGRGWYFKFVALTSERRIAHMEPVIVFRRRNLSAEVRKNLMDLLMVPVAAFTIATTSLLSAKRGNGICDYSGAEGDRACWIPWAMFASPIMALWGWRGGNGPSGVGDEQWAAAGGLRAVWWWQGRQRS